MDRLKKILTGLLSVFLIACLLASCGGDKTEQTPEEDDVLTVYTTFYPIYALTHMVAAGVEDVELHCLVQPQDGCLRDYQLSDWDLALIAGSADAVIAGGMGLESFESLLYSLGDNGPAVSSVLYGMDLQEKQAVNTQPDSDSHWNTPNPHIYLSADGASEIVDRIAAIMQVLDPEHAEIYQDNAENSKSKLQSVFESLNAAATAKAIVMNEALIYTAEVFGFEIDLCYDRDSGEALDGSELQSCLNLLAQSSARIVLIEKQAPQNLCKALEDAGYIVARLDILSTRRAEEGSDGYFEALGTNDQTINKALLEAAEAVP